MSINQRIKKIRKDKHWNQTYLASILGITQSGVSYMEQEGSTISDQTIKSICLAVPGLSERWLRDGIEPMYISNTAFSLDQFVKERGGTELELEVMKAYFNLPKDVRKAVMNQLQTVFTQNSSTPTVDDEPEKLHAELDHQLNIQKAAKEKSKASLSTG